MGTRQTYEYVLHCQVDPVMVTLKVEEDGNVCVVLCLAEQAAAALVQQQLGRVYSSSGSLSGAANADAPST